MGRAGEGENGGNEEACAGVRQGRGEGEEREGGEHDAGREGGRRLEREGEREEGAAALARDERRE